MQLEISEDGFLNMLATLNKSAVVAELDHELIRSVQAIIDHGGKAQIKLTININRIKNMESAVSIDHDIAVKVPREKRPEKAMFINASCGLVNQHQEQISLDMRPSGTGNSGTELKPGKSNVAALNPKGTVSQ